MERNQYLLLTDEQLLAQCRCDTMRGTGPGGQKRNKTESAVRLVHQPTGLTVTDDVSRSQHTNRDNALLKLRYLFALEIRMPFQTSNFSGNPTNQQLPLWMGHAFDALEAFAYQVAPAAKQMGMTTSCFLKFIAKYPLAWQKLGAERQKRALPVLKMK